jgi:phage gpG-like protein
VIGMTLSFPDLSAKLQASAAKIRQELVVAMQTNRGMLFDAEGAYNGHEPWKQLLLRAGQILASRGVLKKSLAPGNTSGQAGDGGYVRADQQMVTIGTDVAYASTMNWGTTRMPGGVMRPTNAQALRIPIPEGKRATETAKQIGKGRKRSEDARTGKDQKFMFVKSVKIPARRFDNMTPQDARDFRDALEAALVEALRG